MKSTLRDRSTWEPTALEEAVGSLPSLDQLTYDYLVDVDDHEPSSDLYISDIGACPRKVMLKKDGATVPHAPQHDWDKQRMFAQAESVQDELIDAMHHAGLLVAIEERVSDVFPPLWGARFDLLAVYPRRRFIEVKSNHPNWIRYRKRYPKKMHVWQATGYEIWAGYHYDTQLGPLVYNCDRGGSNPSLQFEVDMPRDWLQYRETMTDAMLAEDLFEAVVDDPDYALVARVCHEMMLIEEAYAEYRGDGIIPAPLERAFDYAETKDGQGEYINSIYLSQDNRCSWCDYKDTKWCHPPTGQTGVLKRDSRKDKFRVMKNGVPFLEDARKFIFEELGIHPETIKDDTQQLSI